MTERAKCAHCGKAYAKRNMRQNPDGGAVCKDWFACQQRRDAARAHVARPRPAPFSGKTARG